MQTAISFTVSKKFHSAMNKIVARDDFVSPSILDGSLNQSNTVASVC